MLRLQPLQVRYPTSWEEAVQALQEPGATRLLAGGTDLLPALKTEQTQAEVLVSLARIGDRSGIEVAVDHLRIAAGTTLAELAASPLVPQALALACQQVAGPQIRQRATLGGNLCLDTRCRYVNQTSFHRQALGGCLKSHGSVCHVVAGGKNCVAALSSDTVPVLLAVGAKVELLGPQGERSLPLAELYNSNGLDHLNLQPGELIRWVRVPLPPASTRVVYRKWRPRKSLDFPLVSLALRLDREGAVLRDGLLVVGVLGPKPRVFSLFSLAGQPLQPSLAEPIVALAQGCRPLPNVPYDPGYRRERLLVEVRRAVREAL